MSALDVMRRVLTAYETHDLLGMEAHMQDLRLAIEQAERQEPVAWCQLTPSGQIAFFDGKPMVMVSTVGNEHHMTPLYTAPPQRQPLTEEQVYEALPHRDRSEIDFVIVRAIERKHGIGGEE